MTVKYTTPALPSPFLDKAPANIAAGVHHFAIEDHWQKVEKANLAKSAAEGVNKLVEGLERE